MPRKITAWACQYKCGHRINTHRQAIEYHEAKCIFNPARKSCATCVHGEWVEDWDDAERRITYRDCDLIPYGKICVVGCTSWEGR